MNLASIVIPLIIVMVGGLMALSKKNATEAFLSGARDGLNTCVSIFPSLLLLNVAVSMFNASGAIDILCKFLSPLADLLCIPSSILPIIVMRPISGSATTAMMQELLEKFSPDSFTGFCASVIAGSSDTIIYTLSVYFASVGVKKSRHAVLSAFIVLAVCVLFSSFLSRLCKN